MAAHQTDALDPISGRAPLILNNQSFADITNAVAAPMEQTSYKGGWMGFGAAVMVLGLLLVSVGYLIWQGTGIWGLNTPVGWGWAIVNFVFWVGIGHAGTLISAILFLFRQKWRTSINRYAEAMTIFAVICALVFPTIHVGRVWLLYWVFPIPNQMEMWPNFMSPLLWDVFAVSTYFTVSLLFWYVGLIPDFATMRDRSKTKIRKAVYGAFSLGWRVSEESFLKDVDFVTDLKLRAAWGQTGNQDILNDARYGLYRAVYAPASNILPWDGGCAQTPCPDAATSYDIGNNTGRNDAKRWDREHLSIYNTSYSVRQK